MGKWEMILFTDIFVDVTSKATKIPKENYLGQGKFQIIDQGKDDIAGYTNEHSGLFAETPAIVFGDHTRILKYVDQPLFIGADGVKLLKSKLANVNYRYLYYALYSVKIENTGYNRHFKWLKESEIPLPPLDEQKRIAKNLDLASEIAKGYKEQLAELDKLVQSVFYEMFGDPVTNEKGWDVKKLGKMSNLKAGKNIKANQLFCQNVYHKYPCYGGNGIRGYIDKFSHDGIYSLIGRQGALCGNVQLTSGKFYPTEHAVVVSPKISIEPLWLNYTLKLLNLNRFQTGAAQPGLNIDILSDIDIITCDMPLQTRFASIVTEIEAQKAQVQRALTKAENLFNSLMQEYFE